LKNIKIKISGMTCVGCSNTIERALSAKGIEYAKVDYENMSAFVSFDENVMSSSKIIDIINSIGHYKAENIEETVDENRQNIKKHLVIIGGGSAAFAAAIQAKEYGVKITMINDGLPIGGTCVNVGCVPSKYLIRASETLFKVNNNPFKGIESKGEVSNFKKIINDKEKLVLQLRKEKYIDILKQMEYFELIEGRAQLLSNKEIKIGNRVINATHVLIATGASSMIPDIDGLDSVDYLTNIEAFELDNLPKSMMVLGGGYIALEIAQMFSRFGTEITLLQRSSQILSKEQKDISDELIKHFENEGIKVVTDNNIQNIYQKDNQVEVVTDIKGKIQKYCAEKIVVATGRVPNTTDLGIDNAGVKIEKNGSVMVNKYMQTNVPNIYAAGDVTGRNMFVYTAAYEAKSAVINMFSNKKQPADFSIVPWVVFTDPQVAGVGMDEKEAVQKGIDYDVAVLPLSYVPRSIVAKDTRGFIKLIRDKESDLLIGARIVSPEGSELLMEVAMAIKFGINVSKIKDMLHPYLTLSEGIKLSAITFDKSVKSLSCCAT